MDDSTNPTTAGVLSVEELFSNNAGKLHIPAYQRKYAWTAEQIDELCKDIRAAVAEKHREYHIGTLILHENGERLDVVDGQQRLTTICLLLADPATCRLEVESSDKKYSSFGKISDKDANELREAVCAKGVNIESVRQFLPKCTFVVITVKNVEEAFQLFDTQNGRGRPLTPDNLLKAFHFHEMTHGSGSDADKTRQYELESAWEGISKGGEVEGSREQALFWRDNALLPHLIGEHLFRLRRWCRGDDALRTWFDKSHLSEFKGITLGDGRDVPPCHADAFLRQFFRRNYGRAGLCLDGLPSRLGQGERNPRFLDPFQSILQPIVNGEDFFLYILHCATTYKLLFGDIETSSLDKFRSFHKEFCLDYDGSWNKGDRYSRHVFESLCLLMFDRFGRDCLLEHYRLLYRFAYWERSRHASLWPQSAGAKFAPPAIRAMVAHETLAELGEALAELQANLDAECKADPRLNPQDRYLFEKGWNLVSGE